MVSTIKFKCLRCRKEKEIYASLYRSRIKSSGYPPRFCSKKCVVGIKKYGKKPPKRSKFNKMIDDEWNKLFPVRKFKEMTENEKEKLKKEYSR